MCFSLHYHTKILSPCLTLEKSASLLFYDGNFTHINFLDAKFSIPHGHLVSLESNGRACVQDIVSLTIRILCPRSLVSIQLSPKGEVNSGGYIPRRFGSRYIFTVLHRP